MGVCHMFDTRPLVVCVHCSNEPAGCRRSFHLRYNNHLGADLYANFYYPDTMGVLIVL